MAEMKWIPVTERMPEDDKSLRFHVDGTLSFTTVLAYKSYGAFRIVNRLKQDPCGIPYLDEHATNGWEWSIGGESITHWMPLPEPPKEGE